MPGVGRAALWSPEALDDRENIWEHYVGIADQHTAEKMLREIAEVIALIEDSSFYGTVAKRGSTGPPFFRSQSSRRLLSRDR